VILDTDTRNELVGGLWFIGFLSTWLANAKRNTDTAEQRKSAFETLDYWYERVQELATPQVDTAVRAVTGTHPGQWLTQLRCDLDEVCEIAEAAANPKNDGEPGTRELARLAELSGAMQQRCRLVRNLPDGAAATSEPEMLNSDFAKLMGISESTVSRRFKGQRLTYSLYLSNKSDRRRRGPEAAMASRAAPPRLPWVCRGCGHEFPDTPDTDRCPKCRGTDFEPGRIKG
jgi:hypothetical protein